MPYLLLIIALRFTCDEIKIWENIKKSQDIMKITVGARFQLKLTASNFAQKGISDGKWKK